MTHRDRFASRNRSATSVALKQDFIKSVTPSVIIHISEEREKIT